MSNNTLYNGTVEIQKVHPYKVLDTEEGLTITPPGVTTITGQFSKEAIPQWAANEAAKEALRLKLLGKLSDDEIYEVSRKRYIELRDDAAEGGTEGHKWIETYVSGEIEDDYSFESEHGIQFVEAYLEFEQDFKLSEQLAETMLYSRKYRYAGIRDNLAVVDGTLMTIDYKTGNPDFEYSAYKRYYTGNVRAYDAHFMQCAGYDIADEEENGHRSEAYGVLYLVKNPEELAKKYNLKVVKRYFFFVTKDTDYWRERFLNARDAWYLAHESKNKYKEVS